LSGRPEAQRSNIRAKEAMRPTAGKDTGYAYGNANCVYSCTLEAVHVVLGEPCRPQRRRQCDRGEGLTRTTIPVTCEPAIYVVGKSSCKSTKEIGARICMTCQCMDGLTIPWKCRFRTGHRFGRPFFAILIMRVDEHFGLVTGRMTEEPLGAIHDSKRSLVIGDETHGHHTSCLKITKSLN
jgi:hypothetical protein